MRFQHQGRNWPPVAQCELRPCPVVPWLSTLGSLPRVEPGLDWSRTEHHLVDGGARARRGLRSSEQRARRKKTPRGKTTAATRRRQRGGGGGHGDAPPAWRRGSGLEMAAADQGLFVSSTRPSALERPRRGVSVAQFAPATPSHDGGGDAAAWRVMICSVLDPTSLARCQYVGEGPLR